MKKIKFLFFYLIRLPILIIYKLQFQKIHYTSIIKYSHQITPRYIECSKYVYIARNARIEGISIYNKQIFNPQIIICDRVSIQQNLHLTCAKRIYIGSNTAIAANVTITDIIHPYEDVTIPVERQDIKVSPVSIGEDCKIYNNSVILPGVSIGKHVIIGANSVVTHNIPDFCVAVGCPAKIVKRFDFSSNKWLKTDFNGNFQINKN